MRRTILIVDDIKTNRLILERMLRRDYEVLEADSGDAAFALLAQRKADISAAACQKSLPVGGLFWYNRNR